MRSYLPFPFLPCQSNWKFHWQSISQFHFQFGNGNRKTRVGTCRWVRSTKYDKYESLLPVFIANLIFNKRVVNVFPLSLFLLAWRRNEVTTDCGVERRERSEHARATTSYFLIAKFNFQFNCIILWRGKRSDQAPRNHCKAYANLSFKFISNSTSF